MNSLKRILSRLQETRGAYRTVHRAAATTAKDQQARRRTPNTLEVLDPPVTRRAVSIPSPGRQQPAQISWDSSAKPRMKVTTLAFTYVSMSNGIKCKCCGRWSRTIRSYICSPKTHMLSRKEGQKQVSHAGARPGAAWST